MKLTTEQIASFQTLYKKELGIALTPEAAVKEIDSLEFFIRLCMAPKEKEIVIRESLMKYRDKVELL